MTKAMPWREGVAPGVVSQLAPFRIELLPGYSADFNGRGSRQTGSETLAARPRN